MKRRQKRYTSEKQILDEIDSSKQTAQDCLNSAIACDARADAAFKSLPDLESQYEKTTLGRKRDELWGKICVAKELAQKNRKEAQKLSKRRNRIEQIKLPKLKKALAEFRTGLLAPVTNDPAVVV